MCDMSDTQTTLDRLALVKALTQLGVAERLAWLVDEQATNLRSTESRLRQNTESVDRVMAQVRRSLEVGTSVNSLGELQSLGTTVDRLCAEREQQRGQLVSLLAALVEDAEQRSELLGLALRK